MKTPPHKPGGWLTAFSGSKGRKPWGSIVLGGMLLVVATGLVLGARAFQDASNWVAHTNQVRVDVENILVSLNEAESSHRGWLLSGDTLLRRQSLIAQSKAITISEGLPKRLLGTPQENRAIALETLIVKRFGMIEDVATIYQAQGHDPAHSRWMALRKNNPLPAQTRALAEEMLTYEHDMLKERQARTRTLALWVEAMALTGMAISLALVFLSGIAYRRENRFREGASQSTQIAHDRLAVSLAEVEREHEATQGLADFAGLLQGCQSIPEIFRVSTHSIQKILPDTAGSFYLMRSSRDHAEAQADWGDYWKDRPQSIRPPQCWGLRQGRPFCSEPDKLCCEHRQGDGDQTVPGFSTCIPMMAQGNDVGLIFIEHGANWAGAAMAEAVSEHLALAITNMRLRETLRTQSLRDPLTGLSNRRDLDEHLPREVARSLGGGQPLSVLVLDIDHFKRFNDTFGHDAGDAVLREFAHLLQKRVRIEDLVARMGGEEFVVVLPGMAMDTALILANDLRSAVESMEVSHGGISLGKITTSIGLAECPMHAATPELLLGTADAALYRAKNHGRNRVCVSDGSLGWEDHRKLAKSP